MGTITRRKALAKATTFSKQFRARADKEQRQREAVLRKIDNREDVSDKQFVEYEDTVFDSGKLKGKSDAYQEVADELK